MQPLSKHNTSDYHVIHGPKRFKILDFYALYICVEFGISQFMGKLYDVMIRTSTFDHQKYEDKQIKCSMSITFK